MHVQSADQKELGQSFLPLGSAEQSQDERDRGGASTSSLSIVLGSSIVNTVNLFTSDWGALITSRATQNPLSLGDKTLLLELHLSTPTDLQSTPPAALW